MESGQTRPVRRTKPRLTPLREDCPLRQEPMMTEFTRMTPRQRSHATYMLDVMQRLEWDFHHTIHKGRRIPAEWAEIARATPHQTKVKVTLDIEADVLKFFKTMGKGHGPRMNDVLKAYMHARIAGVIEGPDTIRQYHAEGGTDRPEWGDISRMMGVAPEDEPVEAMSQAEVFDRAVALMVANRARVAKAMG
jgi:uncharacterized protein (DUF4415 family)